jgi:mono/diheme cytochrome c family protein
LLIGSSVAIVAAVSACGGGQTQTAAPSPAPTPTATASPAAPPVAAVPEITGPSTLDSVYSTEQAQRGKDVYFGTCRSCHAPGFFTSASFSTHWKGKPLSQLYTYVAQKMPGNDPGSLGPEAVADVLAYMLQLNLLPAGQNEIWPDADSLKKFTIAIKK